MQLPVLVRLQKPRPEEEVEVGSPRDGTLPTSRTLGVHRFLTHAPMQIMGSAPRRTFVLQVRQVRSPVVDVPWQVVVVVERIEARGACSTHVSP